MLYNKQKLLLTQVDTKLLAFRVLASEEIPKKGWIHTIRTALKMTQVQLGKRLGISKQSVQQMEERESNGAITLRSLQEVAMALDMRLVYGLIPNGESLEAMIEKKAQEIAEEIVMRTNNTMVLEDQQVGYDKIKKSISAKATELKESMPRYLWD